MKWVTFSKMSQERVGLLHEDMILALPPGERLIDLLGDEGETLARAAERAISAPDAVFAFETAELMAPIPQPPSIRDFYAFEQHARAGRQSRGLPMAEEWFQIPVFYFTNPGAVTGSGTRILGAPGSRKLDFEAEVAAVVGLPAGNIAPEKAGRHIVGLMVMNDWSARDLQRLETSVGLGPAKGKDFATTLGPCLVTMDELEPYRKGAGFDLAITVTVNGKLYTQANLADIYWSFEEMLSFASRGTTVRTGDILGSGTCATGCILELAQTHGEERFPWLASSDHVVVEVERLGRLSNSIDFADDPAPLRQRSVT
ncbi:fumarylacetoacetate hydrolase family protein [Rhizobium terrae]|uniref:fumarylacetoacetate hydrolase family protein n=1 Tax=Rhizobium terrae TaxID=2171756 RepID=UPI000E3DE4CB|nr:fumarylacetoacetate hydrolase family protein [Rhizobium terrae]